MRSTVWILATVAAMVAAQTDAALVTYYDEDFNAAGGSGVRGPVPPNPATFTSGSFSVDASGATLRNQSDFAFVNGTSFQFRDLGGTGGGPGTGTAVLTSQVVTFFAGTAPFGFLNTTLNATLSAAAAGGDGLLIETLVNGVVTDSTTLTAAGGALITHDITDNIIVGANNTWQIRVTATQSANVTYSVDNLLMQGASTPEPASLSMLGMGIVAMCGAGYRRRRRQDETVE